MMLLMLMLMMMMKAGNNNNNHRQSFSRALFSFADCGHGEAELEIQNSAAEKIEKGKLPRLHSIPASKVAERK